MIGAYLVDDIKIIKSGGTDSWNEPLGTTEISTKGRFEYKTEYFREAAGEARRSEHQVLLLKRELSHADKIEYEGIKYTILRITKPKSFTNHFMKVYLE